MAGPAHIGHEKQLRVHLEGVRGWHEDAVGIDILPVALDPEVAARNLEETIGAVVRHSLLIDASWTSYLLAVLAEEQVLEGI